MISQEENLILDKILKARRSCRKFTDRIPDRETVAEVIEAGRIAPFAVASACDVDVFRHVFVLFRGNPLFENIDRLIREQCGIEADRHLTQMETDPFVREYGSMLQKHRAQTAKAGLPVFPDPPCMIILAEWRGVRKAERQDLAHVLQNMWLKATALNLGFCILSPVEELTDNEEFCSLFGLPAGAYGFHACVLGYKETADPAAKTASSQIHWL